MAAYAFNPNEGAEPAVTTRPSASRLPSTAPLFDPMPKLSFAPIQASRQTPSENQPLGVNAPPPGAFVQPMPPTLEPAPVADAPQFPPVDVAVAARAQQELQSTPQAQGFIAPAPLLGAAPVNAQRPIENPVPAENPIVARMPEPLAPANGSVGSALSAPSNTPALSDASRSILSKFPSKLNSATSVKGNGKALAINRLSPEIKSIATPETKVDSFSATGLSIKVQRPGLDTNFELNRAYSALTAGDTATAIETYRTILSTEPKNEDALFGLATTYHRVGNLDQARPYYAQLLTVNPNHREGLNNFLALVSDEAPQEALAELERLEQRNPDFSPIPAQQAALLSKSGFADQARDKMLRAIELAPDF
ncbi:MAG: tetratricopeptide repeat protein [Rickettsiales bacterium]|nr:tetratricopeptide repeat protein [Rickettsiales bacterium]